MQTNSEKQIPEEEWVKQLFSSDQTFKTRQQEQSKKYTIQLQIARYGDLKQIAAQDIIMNAGIDNEGYTIIYIFGQRQPDEQKMFEMFMQQFIVMFDDKINNGFRLVYFNTGQITTTKVSRFIEFYKLLPMKYYQKLFKFYIVHGSMMVKLSWLWYEKSVQNQALKKKLILISRLNELAQEGFVGKYQYVLIPNFVKDNDSTSQEESKSENAYPPILKVHLHEYELNNFGIPIVLDVLVSTFLIYPNYLVTEGIFRRNASISKMKQAESLLRRKQYTQVQNYDDPHSLADIMKDIFSELLVPVIPFSLYKPTIEKMKKSDPVSALKVIKEMLAQLADINLRLIIFIFGFLIKIVEQQSMNKMTAYNVAVVFGPAFIRPEVFLPADILDAGTVVKTVQLLIDNYEHFFPNENFEKYLTFTGSTRSASVFIHSEIQQQPHRSTVDFSGKK